MCVCVCNQDVNCFAFVHVIYRSSSYLQVCMCLQTINPSPHRWNLLSRIFYYVQYLPINTYTRVDEVRLRARFFVRIRGAIVQFSKWILCAPSIQISKGNKARNRGRESFRRHFNILYLHEHVVLLINNNEGGARCRCGGGGRSLFVIKFEFDCFHPQTK